jgi:DNA-binding FadR family transcriptional regulator
MPAVSSTTPAPNGTSLHRRIVHGLGRQILSGKIAPGQPVPMPAGLTASRTAVREAIKVLTAKGLVEARPRVGTRVRSREHWQLLDADVIAWQSGGRLGAAFLNELTEVREILEPATAAMAASRATRAEIADIEHAYADMVHASAGARVKLDAWVDADTRFHAGILRASHNRLLNQMGQTVFSALVLSFRATTSRPGAARASLPRHRAILDAIKHGRPEAARRAMLRLMAHTAREVHKIEGTK